MELLGFIAVGIAGWLGLGYITSSYFFAYFQREFPTIAKGTRTGDKLFSFALCLVGPIGAVAGGISLLTWAIDRGRGLYHGFDFGWPWA